jgi:dTDP-4-dehydrorhamnose 3,5-epimerase
MRFEPLALDGAWLITPEQLADERGFFARTICVKEFTARGLNGSFVQSSISYNRRRGTFRGIHFQWPPSQEAKLVRCLRGRLVDILLDLRPDSKTFLRHIQVALDDSSRNSVYIPSGFGHGFQTLADDVEVQYHMTDEFRPDLAGGYRWDDPTFSIELQLPISVIASRDAGYAPFDRSMYETRFRAGLVQPKPA